MSLVMSPGRHSRKEDSGPLRSLNRERFGGDLKRFPLNIEGVDNFMKIVVYKDHKFESEIETSQGVKSNSSLLARKEILDTLILPMPSGLATAYAQNYDDAGVGPIGATMGVAASNAGEEGFNNFRNAMVNAADPESRGQRALGRSQLKKQFSGLANSVKEQLQQGGLANLALEAGSEAAPMIGAAVGESLGGIPGVGAVGGAIAGRSLTAAQAGFGVTRNPHMAVIYKTPNFRVFNFQWQLRPKSYKESIEIHRIIHSLKFHSAPTYIAGSHFLKYPNQFGLSFKNNKFLYTMGTVVLKNFNVDYHGEGTPIYHDAPGGNRKFKAPAVVNISTEFQEISILTKEGIEKAGR